MDELIRSLRSAGHLAAGDDDSFGAENEGEGRPRRRVWGKKHGRIVEVHCEEDIPGGWFRHIKWHYEDMDKVRECALDWLRYVTGFPDLHRTIDSEWKT